jgi:hypothetical protein
METNEIVLVRKKSIYNLQSEYIDLMNQIEDNEGELTPELSAQLDITKEQLEDKATSYCYLTKQLDADTDQIDAEIKRLQALKSAKAKLQEELKNRVAEAMQRFGIEKIEKNNLKLSFRKSESLLIDDDAKVPNQFVKIKMTESVDKVKLKEYIQSGNKINGILVITNQNLQIK